MAALGQCNPTIRADCSYQQHSTKDPVPGAPARETAALTARQRAPADSEDEIWEAELNELNAYASYTKKNGDHVLSAGGSAANRRFFESLESRLAGRKILSGKIEALPLK